MCCFSQSRSVTSYTEYIPAYLIVNYPTGHKIVKPRFPRGSTFFISVFILIACIVHAENWIIISGGYQYDKDSITTIDNLKQVYDGEVTKKGQMTRQVMVDCSTKKYALGEVVQYVGGREISRTYWARNGFVWLKPNNKNLSKLINIVCKTK